MYTRAELEEMKMDELRKIGDPIGAKDTSKMELIEEILKKQPRPPGQTDTEKLIDRLLMAEGDILQTYEFRDDIITKLKKLAELEKGG